MDALDLAIRSADILGPSSAAHKALAELWSRMNAGEEVGIWRAGNTWVVGPIQNPTPQKGVVPGGEHG